MRLQQKQAQAYTMPQSRTTVAALCLIASSTAGFAFITRTPALQSHQLRAKSVVPVFRIATGLREPQSRWIERRRWAACSMEVGGRRGGGGTFDPLRFGDASRSEAERCHGDNKRRFKSAQQRYMRNSKSGPEEGSASPILQSQFRQGGKVKGSSSKTKLGVLNVGVDDVGVNFLKERAISALTGVGEGAGPAHAASAHANGPNIEKQGQGNGWEYWGYRALLVAVAAIMGTNFPVVKFVENHAAIPDASAAFVRFSIAAGAMLPFADWKQKEVLVAGLEVGMWMAIGYCTQAIGLQTSEASVCAFLCSLTVVFVPLFGAVFGNGIKLVTIAASLLALLGTGFLELGDASASWSDLWCVAQAVAFAMGFLRIEHYMRKFPGQSLQLSIGQLVTIAAATGVWCAWSAGGHLPDFSFLQDPQIAAASGYTGLITTALALWLQTVALEKVSAAEMSIIFTTEPMWATLVSVTFLKETMGPNAAVGAGFILLACLTAQSEQILGLLGMGTKEVDDNTDINGAVLDYDAPTMVGGEEVREDQALAHHKVSEEISEPITLAMRVLDEQGLEVSTADFSKDVKSDKPSLEQYVVPVDVYAAEEGLIVEGVGGTFEYFPALVKELA